MAFARCNWTSACRSELRILRNHSQITSTIRASPPSLPRRTGDYALQPAAPELCPRRACLGGANDPHADHDFHRDELGGESIRTRSLVVQSQNSAATLRVPGAAVKFQTPKLLNVGFLRTYCRTALQSSLNLSGRRAGIRLLPRHWL